MTILSKAGTANLNATRESVTRMVAECAASQLTGVALELTVMDRLSALSPLNTLDDAVLITIAGMAIARLVEHERGERSTAA